ncbi:MAG: sugar phosphate isomerase/epimerase family protein [Planctomycetota bacterium]|jgi:sugar phosphate isomerase/epimerase
MRKGMWTSYFHEMIPEEAVALFARQGWTDLELSTEHAAALLERGDPEATGAEFRRFCSGLGVQLPQGHLKLGADIAAPDRAERRRTLDELKQWLDLFAALGVEAAVLHPGGRLCLKAGPAPREVFEASAAALTELVAHSGGRVAAICLENGGSARELVSLIGAAGGQGLGICLDTGHLSVVRAQAPDTVPSEYDFVLQAGVHLKALHVADNDGSADQHRLPFAGGAADWDGLIKGLREVGYGGLFNFEVPGETNCPLAERLEKLDAAGRIAERLLGS